MYCLFSLNFFCLLLLSDVFCVSLCTPVILNTSILMHNQPCICKQVLYECTNLCSYINMLAKARKRHAYTHFILYINTSFNELIWLAYVEFFISFGLFFILNAGKNRTVSLDQFYILRGLLAEFYIFHKGREKYIFCNSNIISHSPPIFFVLSFASIFILFIYFIFFCLVFVF